MKLETTQNSADFIKALNKQTNFNTFPTPKVLKYNAEEGLFYISTESKDENDRTIYKLIGENASIHIITTRKMMQGRYKTKFSNHYSREFMDDYLEVFDENKNIVFKGLYSNLKNDEEHELLFSNLQFNCVLYCFYGEELCRMKLAGSKLGKLFDYQRELSNDNPARYYTIVSQGPKQNSGGIDYFEINFNKGDEIEQQMVINRVNAVNGYITAYKTAKAQNSTVEAPKQVPQEVIEANNDNLDFTDMPPEGSPDHPSVCKEEINVENMPF